MVFCALGVLGQALVVLFGHRARLVRRQAKALAVEKLELAECTDVGEHSLQQAVCESMQQQSVSVAARVRSARSVDALVPTESTVRSGAGFALNAGRNGITLVVAGDL